MISVKIVADSCSSAGDRITTFVLTYPRFIHAEVLTHRKFTRNSASSRAIPISKMIDSVLRETAMPVSWGVNGKGMQAKRELIRSKAILAKLTWKAASVSACGFSWLLSKIGVHKQLANRVTEPFSHMTTIVTATDYGNFFALRAHPDAQPEFQDLAYKMLGEYNRSTPKLLTEGEWHLPFADRYIRESKLTLPELIKIAVARCARVSYLNFEGSIDYNKDFALHDDLLKSGHMSPFEHVATPCPGESGNFCGFKQYRKTISGENRVYQGT